MDYSSLKDIFDSVLSSVDNNLKDRYKTQKDAAFQMADRMKSPMGPQLPDETPQEASVMDDNLNVAMGSIDSPPKGSPKTFEEIIQASRDTFNKNKAIRESMKDFGPVTPPAPKNALGLAMDEASVAKRISKAGALSEEGINAQRRNALIDRSQQDAINEAVMRRKDPLNASIPVEKMSNIINKVEKGPRTRTAIEENNDLTNELEFQMHKENNPAIAHILEQIRSTSSDPEAVNKLAGEDGKFQDLIDYLAKKSSGN